MTDLILPRRKFLTGLMGLVAAPAVVKASSLMPAKSFVLDPFYDGFTTHDIRVTCTERMTMAQFRSIVEPALRESFDRAYDANKWDNFFGSVGK